jgi:hypothetical protein
MAILTCQSPSVFSYKYCNVQGVARHWRNRVRTRAIPLDSSNTLYIVYLAYIFKPMDNVVRFLHPCIGPVRLTHVPIIINLCVLSSHLLPVSPVRFTYIPITDSACAFLTPTPITRLTCASIMCVLRTPL